MADAIWAKYSGKFPVAATAEIMVAAATTDGHRGHSLSPHRSNTQCGDNRGCSKACQEGGKSSNGSRHQT